VTRTDFLALLDRLADGWAAGDAEAVAAEFADFSRRRLLRQRRSG
jgi:hypothetical protein